MTVQRPMGIETEYGISVPGRPHANPMLASGRVVQAHVRNVAAAGGSARPVRWDYTWEAPLDDARGFSWPRGGADPSQLTDEWAQDPRVANLVLTNGARLYVDHAHPEYSSPEVLTPMEALTWDRAGDVVAAACAARLGAEGDPEAPNLYKNNTDGKGASYGTHENYLTARSTPFARIVAGIMPFFVVRQVLCGAGRVGIGTESQRPGYQISSRADFIEAEVGLETTFKRPIVNTRDEPHATPERYRRLHVIVGDANLCDVAGLLKLGTTSLVLGVVEAGLVPGSWQLRHPVPELRAVSHDPDLAHLLELVDGTRLTACDLLWRYHDLVDDWLSQQTGVWRDADTAQVMAHWERVLTALGTDRDTAAADVDWVAKLRLLRGYRERDGLTWDDLRLRALDIQFSDVRPEKSLARRLEARGRITRLVDDAQVAAATVTPPESTRAWFRGECVRRYPQQVVAASWEAVVFDTGGGHRHRVSTLDPVRSTRAESEEMLDACPEALDLIERLSPPD